SPGQGWVATPVGKAQAQKGKVPASPKSKLHVTTTMKWGNAIVKEEVDLVDVADLDNPIGYKGNYMIFPLKQPTFLTSYMLQEFVDDYFGVRDPDELGNYTIEELEHYVACVQQSEDISEEDKASLRAYYLTRLEEDRRASDMVIVPTGQL